MKILLFNYYWPPSGGPAVQRWLDITNRLEDLGLHTYVVTIDPEKATFPFLDKSLNSRIHPSTKTYETDTSELFDFYKKYIGKGKVPGHGVAIQSNEGFKQKVARFIRGNFLLPDPRRGWNKHAIKQGIKIIEQENVDIIITAGPPHSTHLIGKQLKKRYPNIHWIADFHDYWTEISYLKKLFYRTKIASAIDRKIEKRVLKAADYVMTHCQSSIDIQQEKSGKDSGQFILYRMGYKEHLFPKVTPQGQDRFVIAYVGMMAGFYNPLLFFKALKHCIDLNKDVSIILQFVGTIDSETDAMLSETGLVNNIEKIGYVSHDTSVRYMYNSTTLLLVNPQFQYNKFHVPGKLYEYLAAHKPIIALSARGSENEKIIKSLSAGENFDHQDYDGIAGYLNSLITKWKIDKNLDIKFNKDVEIYGRDRQSNNLADKLKSIIGKK